jgi:hypothetical protein
MIFFKVRPASLTFFIVVSSEFEYAGGLQGKSWSLIVKISTALSVINEVLFA